MRYLIAMLALFSWAYGETIQNVEYHLPAEAQTWVVGNKFENEKGTTIIYVPSGAEKKHSKEFFGVSANNLKSTPDDIQSVKKVILAMYPHLTIDFKIIESGKEGALYEWSGSEKDIEKVHGFGRMFFQRNGTVLLSFQTENVANIGQARTSWLNTLKDAK